MADSTLWREIREQRKRLTSRDDETARYIVSLYSKADDRIKARLEALVRKIEAAQRAGIDLVQEHPSWLPRQAEYHRMLDIIEIEMQRFGDRTLTATGSGSKTSVKEAVSDTLAIQPTLTRPSTEALEQLASAFKSSPVANVLGRAGVEAKERAEEVLFSGLANGDNPRKIGLALSDVMLEGVRRATGIARTEILRAYRGASQTTYRKNADVVRGWRWMCAFNERTCPTCIAMDGTEHPLDEEFASHPSCRCTTLPLTANSTEQLAGVETGSEWVEKQPAQVQNAIYGRTVAELIRNGALSPGDMGRRVTFHPLWGAGRSTPSLRYLVEQGVITIDQINRARGK